MLKREEYIKKISDSLATFQTSIQFRSSLTLFDENILSEDLIKNLLNIVHGYNLKNLNVNVKNQASIDLGDEANGIAYQITSTKTSQKIRNTIDKFIEYRLYETYPELRIFILQDKQGSYPQFDTNDRFVFDSGEHISDFKNLLATIKTLDVDKLKGIYLVLQQELELKESSSRSSDEGLFHLTKDLQAWFKTLNYSIENSYRIDRSNYFEWIINVPARRGYDRIFIRGVNGVAEISDFQRLRKAVEQHQVDEGWVISARRISQSIRTIIHEPEYQNLFCYTFDELLDEHVDFSRYINWLENEIVKQGINEKYISLACSKDEFDPQTVSSQ